MSSTDVHAAELTDPELISRVRDGDVDAYGMLFSRHVDAATRLARLLVPGADADDLVSEAFMKVLNVLLGGGGPDVAFRAYLLTAVRRLHVDKVRSSQRLTTTDDFAPYDPGVPFTDTAVAGFEGGAAAKAFASLPERWQMVLWHLEVEKQKPADVAPLLGMSPNSVSALAYRAREGLRQAFLNMHSGDLVSEACRDTNDLLGAYVRGALSRRDATRVEAHLERCRRCTAAYLELSEVNSSLAALLGPALLGSAAAAYLGGGGVAASGFGAGLLALVGRGKEAALGHVSTTATAATVAVAGVVGITAITVINRGPQEQPAAAQQEAPDPAPSVTPTPERDRPRAPHRKAAGSDPAGPWTTTARGPAPSLPEDGAAVEGQPQDQLLSETQAPEQAAAPEDPGSAGQAPDGASTQPDNGEPGTDPGAAPPPPAPSPSKPPKPVKPPWGDDESGRGDHGRGEGYGHGQGRGQGHLHGLGHLVGPAVGHGNDQDRQKGRDQDREKGGGDGRPSG